MNAHMPRLKTAIEKADRILRLMGDRAEKWNTHCTERIQREAEGMEAPVVAARMVAQQGAYEQRISELIDLEQAIRECISAVNEANRNMERHRDEAAHMIVTFRNTKYPETVYRTHHDPETVRGSSIMYAMETQPHLY